MQAAVVNILGQPPSCQPFDDPVPQEGEILVQVRAAGLHNLVKAIARGAHYSAGKQVPAVAGVDGVGVAPDGRRVYFVFVRKPWGTMAELAAAPLSRCVPVPYGLDDLQAAAIVNPGMATWFPLKERGCLQKGQTLLIMGATGVSGKLAIQLARHMGAGRIVGAGRNLEALAGADADALISLNEPDDVIREALAAEAAAGIDVVVDYLWGRPMELLLEALARGFNASGTRGTRVVQVGDIAGKTIALPGGTLRSVDLTILGSGFGAVSQERVLAAAPEIFSLAAAGVLKVDVEPIPLANAEEAWGRTMKSRRIVITI